MKRELEATDMSFFCRMRRITWTDHVSNEEVQRQKTMENHNCPDPEGAQDIKEE